MNFLIFAKFSASLAQLVEQLIRNEQVVGSSPIGGSIYKHTRQIMYVYMNSTISFSDFLFLLRLF